MFARKSVLVLLASAGAVSLGLVSTSCSSGSASPSGPSNDSDAAAAPTLLDAKCTDGGLKVAFNPMYSAFDGTHTFQIPAVVVGSDQPVTWFADSSMVGIMADGERPNEVLLTMLKPGITTIHVQSADGKCASAPLTISAALESDWEIGSKRYNDAISVHLAGPPTQGTGSPLEQSGMSGPACTNCHGDTAVKSAYKNVSHTPEQTGGFSDDQILNIVLRGTFPTPADFDPSVGVSYAAWQYFHRWADITTDQQRGIIVYLRSLTPTPQTGAANFGAFDQDSGMTTVTTEAGVQDAATDTTVAPDGGAEAGVDAGFEAAADGGSAEASDDSGGGEAGAPSEAGDGAAE